MRITALNNKMKPPQYPNYRLLVMTKSPQLGQVKTRMQPYLTTQQSRKLHLALLDNTVTRWQQHNVCPIHLWIDGPQRPLFEAMPALSKLPCSQQKGSDLGDKMYWAATATLNLTDVDGIILLGTDCPFIDRDYLASALSYLHAGGSAVIGPAVDGGYVLLGMKKTARSLFENINWGSHTVLSTTLERLDTMAWKYRQLQPLHDIDRPEDLVLLNDPILSGSLRQFALC